MTYELKPDTKLRIYKGSDYFERTWLEVQWDLSGHHLLTKRVISNGIQHSGYAIHNGFRLVHPDAITEID